MNRQPDYVGSAFIASVDVEVQKALTLTSDYALYQISDRVIEAGQYNATLTHSAGDNSNYQSRRWPYKQSILCTGP